ncbi:MAG: CBS domain-containing protein [Candidatus Thiodiazotropha sp.]
MQTINQLLQNKGNRVETVATDATVFEALAIMADKGIGALVVMQDNKPKRVRHLPVMQDNQLIGIISIGDLVKAIIENQQFVIEQLVNYING